MHAGGDIGPSNSWRAGVSYLQTAAEDREYTQTDVAGNDATLSFSGRTQLAIADFVWKWAPNGNALETNFKLQGEYFWRRERGDLTYDADGALGLTQTGGYRANQSGFYIQGVWQFMPQWRVGARYDWLDPGSIDYGANGDLPRERRVQSAAPRSDVRLDAVRIQPLPPAVRAGKLRPDITDNQIFLQYILTLGAHGAHKF